MRNRSNVSPKSSPKRTGDLLRGKSLRLLSVHGPQRSLPIIGPSSLVWRADNRTGAGRYLSAPVADQRMGHGGGPCGAARRWRTCRRVGQQAAPLWQAGLSQPRVRRDRRLGRTVMPAFSRGLCRRRRPARGRLSLSAPRSRQNILAISDRNRPGVRLPVCGGSVQLPDGAP